MLKREIADKVAGQIVHGKKAVNHPRVILLMGLQYSGKSYLAGSIESKNFAHFWATKVKKDYGLDNADMASVATLVLEKLVADKYNTVVDYVNHRRSLRQRFRGAVEALGAECIVVFLDTPKEERLRRREANIKEGDAPGRRVISLEQMEEFEHEFEPPFPDEPTIRLQNQEDIDRFIASL